MFADFIYIIFGGYIYIMLSNLISSSKSTKGSLVNFAKWLILVFVLFYFINGSFSENYYFILLSLGYIFLIKKKYWFSAFVLIPFLIQIKDSNRALLICFVTVVIFYFIYKIGLYLKKQDRIFIFTFLFFFLVFFSQELLSILFEIVPKGSGLHFRIKQALDIFNKGIDFNNPQHISIAQRIVEAKVVVSLWLNNIVSFLFGCGLGGVIDGKLFIDPSVTTTALMGSKSIHNIHLLPFALIHKYGLLGLIIFFMLVIDLLNSFRNIFKKNQSIVFIFWNLIFILIFVYSLPAASFLWASPLFWISLSMKRKAIYKKPF
ncbi:hypothetical protein JL193_08520 [Polaribacter batillariae]|uniref:Oligosaccharide repeat unit polymerase n=1 Tax=Polaribacter batillariae TaxID=2808900 RepID=A0ABX7SSB6_9FLAO|nr:hypothetical protein [Polaribacter batillariae]QTD36213.1 hypothetical protein JL193_08520 [Polaribacter batillariae]